MSQPLQNTASLEAIKALDGRIFAMLSEDDLEILNFYRKTGRKYGVSVGIQNEASPELIAQATSQAEVDQILKSANSRISVTVHPSSDSFSQSQTTISKPERFNMAAEQKVRHGTWGWSEITKNPK